MIEFIVRKDGELALLQKSQTEVPSASAAGLWRQQRGKPSEAFFVLG